MSITRIDAPKMITPKLKNKEQNETRQMQSDFLELNHFNLEMPEYDYYDYDQNYPTYIPDSPSMSSESPPPSPQLNEYPYFVDTSSPVYGNGMMNGFDQVIPLTEEQIKIEQGLFWVC